MLEIRNVTKIYKSKSGSSVKALDNLSMTFPETGMVFVLGKSGSGKSTLLNVIGGLDGYDSGEFIIKGKSSKSFAGSDFDAYRNTFIGFIFQEYNILDDFTVGANIGLALELQGKKATSKKISEILGQVDMLDYAKRKPNELSGGQKQRIAIARALVKDPEIIMADEPTGALDSNTGKQIFDTLKELSRTKLVIVVSHDRDFAEKYGDRIIEMKDGQILSDVTKHEVEAQVISEGILKMNDNLLRIEQGYRLTPKDVEMINEYLRTQPAEILVSGDVRLNNSMRASAGISDNNTSAVFNETDGEKDIPLKDYSTEKTKFIRSRLPMKNALKMGSSSLGHKKFRLVMTILLSMIAFALFGFSDTLGAYDKVVAATDSISDSNVQNASFSLGVKHAWVTPEGEESYAYHQESAMNQTDLDYLSEKTGIDFIPVFNGSDYAQSSTISLIHMMQETDKLSNASAYTGSLYGFTPAGHAELSKLEFPIVGEMPARDNEIAITEFLYRQWNLTGFCNEEFNESVKAGELTTDEDGSKNSIIGKHVTLRLFDSDYTFTVTAVIDTNFDYERYQNYVPTADDDPNVPGEENMLVDMLMQRELANTLNYSFHGLGYITQSQLDKMASFMVTYRDPTDSIGTTMQWNFEIQNPLLGHAIYIDRVGQSSDLKNLGNVTWLDGTARTELGENEIVLPGSALSFDSMEANVIDQWTAAMTKLYGGDWQSYVEHPSAAISEIVRSVAVASYIRDPDQFALVRSDLAREYKAVYGEDAANDDVLKEFWLECLRHNPHALPQNAKTEDELADEAYKAVFAELFGLTVDAGVPASLCQMSLDRLLYSYEEGRLILTPAIMQDILVQQYAYTEIHGNEELYNSELFFERVLAPRGITKEDWSKETAKESLAAEFYFYYLQELSYKMGANEFGEKSYADFSADAQARYFEITGDSLSKYLESLTFTAMDWFNDGAQITLGKYKVVGLFESYGSLVISDTLYRRHDEYLTEHEMNKEVVEPHELGIYAFAIAPMPTDSDAIRQLVEISFDESRGLRFSLQNQVMNTLEGFNSFIEIGAKVFLYIGLGFAIFSALMLMNFISVSISYKRREIGILRAVGARSSDVFKIFFCEAFIIALINYILSLLATVAATTAFNILVRSEGINVTLLHFGPRQIILMFLISLLVAALASFFPVWNIARRKPIDAIKNK